MAADHPDPELMQGLKELAESAFPKRCNNCGRVFDSVRDYVAQTRELAGGRSGLKESQDDDGAVIVELYRNCPCGSTLMDFFGNRRDASDAGRNSRLRFDQLVDHLVCRGMEPALARSELLLALREGRSDVLARLSAQKKD